MSVAATDPAAVATLAASPVPALAPRDGAEAALRAAEDKYRDLFENAVEGIFQTSPRGQYLNANPALARIYGYDSPAELIRTLSDIKSQLYVKQNRRAEFAELIGRHGFVTEFESEVRRHDGSVIWISENARVVRDPAGAVERYEGTVIDITARKQAEAKLEAAQRQLVEAARRDGMAEIATGVLHNVGNVLNSVNVSASLAVEKVRRSTTADLTRLVELLDQNESRLGEFFTSDRQGQQVPRYLRLLADHLTQERATLLEELALVAKNIDHIKTIVSMQQSYAGAAGLIEPIRLTELLEDALRINITSFERHGIVIERDYEDFIQVPLDKQRLLQILVNVIKNAKDAIKHAGVHPGRVTLRIRRPSETHVRLEVADNGIGIPAELLTRIFSHGFTTKADGHGFGLHASANSARLMGGSLTAESAGPGQGATFIVELPIVPPHART